MDTMLIPDRSDDDFVTSIPSRFRPTHDVRRNVP